MGGSVKQTAKFLQQIICEEKQTIEKLYIKNKEEIQQPNARLCLDSYSIKTTVKKNSCETIRKTEHCIKELLI